MTDADWSEVRRLFTAALDAPEGERAGLVRRGAGGDGALEREVLSLLASHEDSADLLEPPGAGGEHAIGPYRVTGELGRGGMGTVYLAIRADGGFVQQAALKVLKRGMDTDEVVQRFQAERQVLAALDHPYIARILDGGTTSAGLPYFAMEYVDGTPIDAYCDGRGLDQRARLALFVKVCGAVAHAHQRLVVHRDIKPANVLVADAPEGSGGDPLPKLLDFGIAKLLDASAGDPTVAASTRTPWMTPEYASPEQARGEAVGTSTDVYSLGVLLYQLLTGAVPFEAPPTDPRLPAAPSARTRGPRITRDLDTIVLHALEPDVAQRYRSVEELADDVERYLDGLPVRAQPATALHRARLFVRRNVAAVGAIVGAFVLLLGTLGVVLVQSAAVRDEADKAQEINAFLSWVLGLVDPGSEGRDVNFAAVVDLAAERVQREFDDRPQVRAALQDTVGRSFHHLGRFEEAEELLSEALATRRAEFGSRAPQTLTSIEHLGELLYDLGELDRALALGEEALAARERAGDPAAVAGALNLLGLIYESLGRYEEASAALERAVDLRREHVGPSEELVLSLNNLALVRASTNRRAASRALIAEAIELQRPLSDGPHPTLATLLFNSGTYEFQAGELALAQERLSEAVDLRLVLLGPEHPNTALAMGSLGAVVAERGDLPRADELTEHSVEVVCTVLGEGYPCASAQYDRGKILALLGRFDEAVEAYERSLAIYLPLGETHTAPLTVEARIIGVLYDAGRFDELHRRAQAFVERCEREDGTYLSPGYVGDALTADARGRLATGDLERAREGLARALEIPAEDRSWRMVWTYVGLADVAHATGDVDAELQAARAALDVLDEKLSGAGAVRSWSRHRLARALWSAGEVEEGRAMLLESAAALEEALPATHPWRKDIEEWRGRSAGN